MKTWDKIQCFVDLRGGVWVALFTTYMLGLGAIVGFKAVVRKEKVEIPSSILSLYTTVLGTFAISKTVKAWAPGK